MLKNNLLYRLLFPNTVTLPPRQNGWFGKNEQEKQVEDTKVRPFRVEVDENQLQDLKNRLSNVKLSESIEGTNFRYGFNSKVLSDVIEYWKSSYDWRKWERELNQFNQYKTKIEGLDVHFVHVLPEDPTGVVLPLLVIHGWPGSVLEYYKALPLLTDTTGGLSFEVIMPSIPGYGFSEAPHQEGFDATAAARFFVKLMNRLGHKRFFVHGGDWGSYISRTIALMYPENVRGIHTTLHTGGEPQGYDIVKLIMAKYLPMFMFYNQNSQKALFTEFEQFRTNWYLESGYFHIQSTKPDTVGAALTDSPVGLAAYILEKFSTWTNPNNVYKPDGGLSECTFSLDELLTNVMIYWLSGNVTSSLRFYKENACPINGLMFKNNFNAAKVSHTVPAAYAVLKHEIVRAPRFIVEMTYSNLVQYSELPRGGHFGAFEEPQLVVEDIKKFARTIVSGP